MNNINFKPTNEMELTLFKLPKNCNCSTCKAIKAQIKAQMGERKYKKLSKEIGFVA